MAKSGSSVRRRGQKRGLRNENALRKRINHDQAFRERLEFRVSLSVHSAVKSKRARLVSGGSATAPTKADILLNSSTLVGVSVKVSQEFEVDQRTVDSLARNLEAATGYAMPDEVRAALRFMVGDFDGKRWPGHLPIRGGGNNRPRPGAGDLHIYEPTLVRPLEEWLTIGLPEITRFAFGCGATVTGHARYLWLYSGDEYDSIVDVEDLLSRVESWLCSGNQVRVGPSASTLSLPFGTLTSASAAPNVVLRGQLRAIEALGVSFL